MKNGRRVAVARLVTTVTLAMVAVVVIAHLGLLAGVWHG